MIVKIHHFRRFLYSFQAFPKLSKGAGRLLRTFVRSEAPVLHPQPFRSTRGASAPQKNAYKQKAPMFCVIHENWWFVHKTRYVWSFLTLQWYRGMAPGSYQYQKVKEGHSYIHKGKRRRTYWRLSDFQRSSRILMIFWAIPWLQKGAGSELGLQRRLWVCKMTQYMYLIVRYTSDHVNVIHTSKAPSVFKN